MCVRCRAEEAPGELGYCAVCALHARVEVVDGFRRFDTYLEAWAAFAAWLDERESANATR
jgi:hypothetical protein